MAATRVAAAAGAGAVLARAAGGGWLAATAATLGGLACGPRLASFNVLPLLVLAVLVERLRALAPRWQLVAVVLVWANVDRGAWVGAGLAILTLTGRALDAGRAAGSGRMASTILLLAVAAVCNPAVLSGREPVLDLGGASGLAAVSPFRAAYREAVTTSPAGLTYFPLLVLSAGSFLLGRWRWERALPWAGLAGLSAVQARYIPAFAVVAGPVLAWNLHDRAVRAGRPWRAVRGLARLAAVGLLVAAWPGWLLGRPYEPRRLAVDLPAAVESAARAVAALGPPGRTLHLSADTLHGFAWFLPAERGELTDPTGEAVERFLAGEGADRLVLFVSGAGTPGPAARVAALADPRGLAHLGGGAAVFTRSPVAAPVDLSRLGFGPIAAVVAPPPVRWYTPFVRPRSAWPADRGEAAVAGMLADGAVPTALARHGLDWETAQTAGLVGAAGPFDLATRLTLILPPPLADGRPPPLTADVLGLIQRVALGRDDLPVGAAYAAVRSARRAVTADPADAAAHHLLGEGYVRLLTSTRERVWAAAVRPLGEFRRVQAIEALERAARLNPRRADTHRLLARLYQEVGYLDLAADHLRAAGDRDDELARVVAARRATLAAEAGVPRVFDRASAAVELGLGGEARRILLGSDVAAFGTAGTDLELLLLARTGRAADVLNWATPDLEAPLGPGYHRLRAAAAAAVGDYPTADAELAGLAGAAVPGEAWGRVVGDRVLGELAGGELLPQVLWRAVRESDFEQTLAGLVRSVDERAEVNAVRGLFALEAGDPAAARRHFAEARAAARPSSVGRRIAEDGLGWVGPE